MLTLGFSDMMKLKKPVKEVALIGLGEIIGTAILMFIGCIGCIGHGNQPPPSWQGSFTFGLGVFMAVQSVGHLSGAHINPSVTLATVVLQMTTLPLAAVYFVSQIIGAIIGFGLIHVIVPSQSINYGPGSDAADFCVTLIREDLSVAQGLSVEILATGLLILFLCGMWDARNARNTDSAPIKPGLAVFVLCVALAPFTGCGMNPARSLAPAIINNNWTQHWVFWVGPLLSSFVVALFYRVTYWPKNTDTD